MTPEINPDTLSLILIALVAACTLLPRARISLWAMPPGDGEEETTS